MRVRIDRRHRPFRYSNLKQNRDHFQVVISFVMRYHRTRDLFPLYDVSKNPSEKFYNAISVKRRNVFILERLECLGNTR